MLLRAFLLSFLLLPSWVVAQTQKNASDVFFDFATDHLDESTIEAIIGSDGLDYIIKHTKSWNLEDAHHFIDSLTRIGLTPNDILKATWITVTFQFSTENHEETEGVSDILFNFATNHLTSADLEKVIEDGWLDDIVEHTQAWSVEDAHHLINSLTRAKIAPDDTLKIIRVTVSFLQKPTLPTALEIRSETKQITQETTKQEDHITEEKSAAEVFINFARRHTGEDFERVMGANWVGKITEYTQAWTANGATEFLDYLVSLIGVDLTLARIKTASYFFTMYYISFRKRVEFYRAEEYLGEEGVKTKLRQSFNGFHTGHVENIKNTIQQIQNVIGKKGIKEIFSKPKVNLGAFSVVYTEITPIVNWLKDHGIPRLEINEAIIRNPQAFTRGKVQNLKAIVKEIKNRVKEYGLPEGITLSDTKIEAKINEAIIRSPYAFYNW